ncbi:hypothetical protein ACMAZH_00650 [Arenicellales bacterium nBUS_45]
MDRYPLLAIPAILAVAKRPAYRARHHSFAEGIFPTRKENPDTALSGRAA